MAAIAVLLRLKTPHGILSFLSATMIFDATLSEIALETFLPADTQTAQALRGALTA